MSDSEGRAEDFRTWMHYYLVTYEDEELTEKVKWAEDAALSTTITRHGDSNESRLRSVAFSLAGAWYEAAYHRTQTLKQTRARPASLASPGLSPT
eukprot:scaffold31819_cov76-Amphora_coffeaeformis.AAC.1